MTAPSNVSVPRHPNATMILAGAAKIGGGSTFDAGDRHDMAAEIYRAMIAAAPSPPIGDTGGVGEVTDAMTDAAEAILEQWGMIDGRRTAARLAVKAALALVPARVEAVDHIADAGKMVPEIIAALIEASNQIEYLHGIFSETVSGREVITKLAEVRRALQGNPS